MTINCSTLRMPDTSVNLHIALDDDATPERLFAAVCQLFYLLEIFSSGQMEPQWALHCPTIAGRLSFLPQPIQPQAANVRRIFWVVSDEAHVLQKKAERIHNHLEVFWGIRPDGRLNRSKRDEVPESRVRCEALTRHS